MLYGGSVSPSNAAALLAIPAVDGVFVGRSALDPAAFVGRDHKDVEKELRELGLEPVKVELENPGDQGEGIVAEVSPTGTVEAGGTVEVRFWGKAPKEPGNGEGDEG